jgi:hypothetical protein
MTVSRICISTSSFSNAASSLKIVYGNTEIPNSSCIEFLDVNIVNNLSWENHIDSLILKHSSACYAIRTIKHFVNQETLLMVY